MLRVKALACDYDGTLATRDRIAPETLAALALAREAGLRLVLVTGRTFFELTRVCERLDLFDAVVAENGAVVYVPAEGAIRDLAPPPPPRLLAELDRRGISYQVGRVIVGTARADEAAVRRTLADTAVHLDLVVNRAALMLLPAGLSKGAAVREVARDLGLSLLDVLALGDAENDVDLFEACGLAGCPGDAVPELRERADWVFAGENGAAVAQAIRGPILAGTLPVEQPRHRVELGWALGTAERVTVPARGVNILVHGDPLSGKSWLAGALVERLVGRGYAVCVVDPEGDFASLDQLPAVTWAQAGDAATLGRILSQFEHDPAACVVADLSALAHPDKVQRIEESLAAIRDLRRRLGRPHWVVLDEAHYSLYPSGIPPAAAGLDDKGFCLLTYKPSWLAPEILHAFDVLVLGRTANPEELDRLRAILADRADQIVPTLADLPVGEFVLVEPNQPDANPVTFATSARQTPHVRHLRKYADASVPADRRFVFRTPDGRELAAADSLTRFREIVPTLPPAVLGHHAARGDFSRWVQDVFSDRALGAQIRKTESRWVRGELSDLRDSLARLIAHRYGTAP
jgi:hypothetical protein